MAVQQFCLRWNNHQPNFISVFTSLLTNESLVDVTLAAEGKQLQAHKVVLSACSTYFQSLFAANPCQHPIVILKDIKYSDLKTMVDFMYYGEVNVSQDQLPAILKTAETLKVKGLAEMPEQLSLSKSISQSSDGKCESQSPISPSVLRRKRLRKSSTGSGSEQTSEETAASGSGSTDLVPPSPLKPGETDESSLRREASSESETREGSHSFEEENYPPRNVSEEGESTTIRWSSSEERPSPSSQPPPQGWTSSREGCSSTLSSSDYKFPYPPSRRKRASNPQQDENFLAALEAVRSGGLGFCKAAKLYGVNNRTLWLEYKKRGYPISRPSTKIRMNDTQPAVVCTPSKPLKVNPIEHTCTVQKLKTPGHPVGSSPHVQSCQVSGSFDYPPPPIYSYTRQEGVYDAMDISKSNMFQVETFLH